MMWEGQAVGLALPLPHHITSGTNLLLMDSWRARVPKKDMQYLYLKKDTLGIACPNPRGTGTICTRHAIPRGHGHAILSFL